MIPTLACSYIDKIRETDGKFIITRKDVPRIRTQEEIGMGFRNFGNVDGGILLSSTLIEFLGHYTRSMAVKRSDGWNQA